MTHTCCHWNALTLKFEVEIIQSIPLVKLPKCPTSLSWYSYLQIVQEPLRHLTPDASFQTPGKRELPGELKRTTWFTAGFCPTTVKLLLLLHSSTPALHNVLHVCPLLQPYSHRPQLYDWSDGGKMTLIHAVLSWLLSWEPKQGIVPRFATNLFPTHTLEAIWLRRGSYYSCTLYQN